ncbi:MAG: multiubiquitin domain-containing protein [Candidatus Omnitrophica bacterium]|nr:multiubiquitin domain-containing protein [Candidatus Omnitrophota bacterium]
MENEGKKHAKQVTIIVNARPETVVKDDISYDEVIALAFPNPPTGDNVSFVVMYRRGHGDKPQGTLVQGQKVKVKEGMIFDVSPNNKS